MSEYNAANHDYSVTAGISGAIFSKAIRRATRAGMSEICPPAHCAAILRSFPNLNPSAKS